MVKCLKCGQEIAKPVASISGGIMGDEYSDVYYLCPKCELYTVESVHDRFCGEETAQTCGPLAKTEGDQKIAVIKRCETPWDKKCRCPAHLDYFGPVLD